MSHAEAVAAAGFAVDGNTDQAASKQSKNTSKQDIITSTLRSIAELRHYILTEHPAELKNAAPSLIAVEAEIFSISSHLR